MAEQAVLALIALRGKNVFPRHQADVEADLGSSCLTQKILQGLFSRKGDTRPPIPSQTSTAVPF